MSDPAGILSFSGEIGGAKARRTFRLDRHGCGANRPHKNGEYDSIAA
ncbi:hypothetical protein BLA24064_02332 [Burkholderia latens]|uniref:Uncharacterized protein n=1 Tax=Burkholderia latens TaxID=488446 RepID=A0A6P2KA06_9BURK|nr:hypothetical protein BLA24064_02332 [Burkholderia latens]